MKEINVLQAKDGGWQPPKVLISLAAFAKLKAYTHLCPIEINGLGIVERIGNDFFITDIFILKQKVSGNSAEIDDMALNLLLYEVTKSGGDPAKLRLQWHSHAHFDSFWSADDVETIFDFGDFMISLVINKQGDYKCRLDLKKPFYLSLDVRLKLLLPSPQDEIIEHCKKEIKEKVEFGIIDPLLRKNKLKSDAPFINIEVEEVITKADEDQEGGKDET